MLCWPRSGGTLLNRLLTRNPNLLVLSEINPNGCGSGNCSGLKAQAYQWYGIRVETDNFADGISFLAEQGDLQNRQLVVRDWTFADFRSNVDHAPITPSFGVIESLKRTEIPVLPFALVRNAIDVWLSQRIEIHEFGRIYRNYVEALLRYRIPIFRYEELCKFPETVTRSICRWSNIPFTEEMLDFDSEIRVNGDIQLQRASRGFLAGKTLELKRKPATRDEISDLHNNFDIRHANEALGYSTDFYDSIIETFMQQLCRRLKYRLRG